MQDTTENIAGKKTQAVKRIIDTAIEELTALRIELKRLDEPDASIGVQAQVPDGAEQLVKVLKEIWQTNTGNHVYTAPGLVIDLGNPEGRSEMLAFATLLAARTREGVAEQTFLALRAAGLLRPERLAAGDASDRQAVLTILRTEYRAVVDKESKMTALFNNQSRLKSEWAGDLHNIYLDHIGDDIGLIKALQSFSHLKRRALWLAREMKVQGVWPTLGTQATEFNDSHVRRVLDRLGFTRTDSHNSWEVARRECEQIVQDWFAGDVIPLYLHGSRLCVHDDPGVCAAQCPVRASCSFWAEYGAELPT